MTTTTETIAGIKIPDSSLAREVTQFVRDVAPHLLFDHSRRVFLWACLQAKQRILSNCRSCHRGDLGVTQTLRHSGGLDRRHRSLRMIVSER
jgi:hypothetical protein